MKNKEIEYQLKLIETKNQTGFFSVVPKGAPSFEESVALLRERPFDSFLHKYVLAALGKKEAATIEKLIDRSQKENDTLLQVLLLEYMITVQGPKSAERCFSKKKIKELADHSPLIHIRSFIEPKQKLHSRWIELFSGNMSHHTSLPSPEKAGLAPVFPNRKPSEIKKKVSVSDLHPSFSAKGTDGGNAYSISETIERAEKCLAQAGVTLKQMMRHQSSLSPIGLLRKWAFDTRIENRRNVFSFSGEQTSYGKGLSVDEAKVSLVMEIVERCSAFASVSPAGVENFQHDYPVKYARYSEFAAQGIHALNPGELSLEVGYRDEPLHWICGETPGKSGSVPAWIPVQCIFLFSNLDEKDLFSGLGSTGFASGNTLEQAKVSALLEVVERHQEATVPVSHDSFFQFAARDEKIAALLDAYRYAGIELQFQDITGPMGIPCCRCFVAEEGGAIQKGAAAHLNAKRAIVSAITENTYPYPDGPLTQPGPQHLTVVGYENLPDYGTGDFKSDLELLEALFSKHGYRPYYIDLTRKDIGIPVVRAIVPGMEIIGDFDAYSRVHPELFQNYLDLFK